MSPQTVPNSTTHSEAEAVSPPAICFTRAGRIGIMMPNEIELIREAAKMKPIAALRTGA
jgi:hypothetical protein